MNKKELLTLKAKINGLAAEGSRTRGFINKSVGDKRWENWQTKRKIGFEARLHLIAYSLLRGMTYSYVEPNVSLESWQWLIGNIDYLQEIILRHASWNEAREWKDKENIKKLLTRAAKESELAA